MAYQQLVRYLRISPKKLRLLGKIIRGQKPEAAITQLSIQGQKGAKFIADGIKTALNNAPQENVDISSFVISSLSCQKGPVFMRRWIKSRGRSTPKRKPTTHLVINFVPPKEKPVKHRNGS